MFCPATHISGKIFLLQAIADSVLDIIHHFLAMSPRGLEHLAQHPVTPWIVCCHGQVFQLQAHIVDAQAVGDGCVDFPCLAGNTPGFRWPHDAQGAHIVQAICQLDKDHPDIPGHGQHHLAEALRMRFRMGAGTDFCQLADTIHQFGDFHTKLVFQLLLGSFSIFDDIMQYRSHQALMVHTHFGQDTCHCNGVTDIGFAGQAFLILVGFCAKQVGAIDFPDFFRGQVGFQVAT